MTKVKTFVSPKKYDCGCWNNEKYYYEEKETGKRICKECYLKGIKKEMDEKIMPKMAQAANEVFKTFSK